MKIRLPDVDIFSFPYRSEGMSVMNVVTILTGTLACGLG
jgi:hypothetical protein